MHRLKGQDVPSGGRLAGEQPGRSRGAVLSRSGRSTEITRRPLPPLGADSFARATSRQSTSKLSMIDIVDLEAGAERSRVGSAEAHAARVRYDVLRRVPASRTSLDPEA